MHGHLLIFLLRSIRKILLPLIHGFFLTTVASAEVSASVCNVETSALSFQKAQQDDLRRVGTLIRLYQDHVHKDIVQAGKYAEEALALSEKLRYAKGLAESKRALGDIQRLKGNFAEAELLIADAMELSERERDDIGLAKGYLAMYKLSFAQGDYKKSAEYNQRSLTIGETTSNDEILAEAYGNEAISFGIGGKHIQAIEYFLKSLNLYRSLGDQISVGLTLLRIGHTFELAGSYEKALEYLLQALEINRKLENWGATGWCLLNIGVTHSRITPDDYTLKLDYYHQALEMAERAGDFRLKLACLDNIGGAWSVQGDYHKANRYLNQAYKLSTSAGHNSRTVFITGNLAENYLYTGQLDSAVFFGEENLRIALDENNTFEKRQAYSVLSQIYARRGDDKRAYQMLLHHTRLSDSIFNVQKSQQIEDLREKYETEDKEQEIEMLTRENAAAVFRRNAFAALSALFLIVGFLVFAILKLRERKNKQLLQKEIELDRMKSRFFANISHEFRTPLTLILGPIDDMIGRPENAGIRKYLAPMRKNAARLLDLVNQLLELSRIESGRLKPTLTRNDMNALVKGIAMSFHSLAEIKNIRLEVLVRNPPPPSYIDRDKFEKILTNLLSNAFKFTPEDGSVTVILQKTSDCHLPGNEACMEIIVEDSGRGITSDELDHIFDRFYQADNNQLLQQDGSGIGLALTKELVELHRGTIRATSEEAKGTRITVHIPLNLDVVMPDCVTDEPDADQPIELQVIQSDVSVSNSNGSREHAPDKPIILLIEDHTDVRLYIRDILADTYHVIEASDGEAGVADAVEYIPDLILCDVMMPKMNGHQVCNLLKEQEKTSHIPIIMLTAKADVDSRIEGLESKADDYLTKPFVPKELLIRIRNLIESRQRLREKYRGAMVLRPNEVAASSIDEKFLKKLMDILEVNMGNDKFSVEVLSTELSMSRSQLHRKLKALIGQGPNQLIRAFRLNRAHALLKAHAATAAEIAYTVGFASPSYFTKCFHEEFGYTPSELVNQ